MDGNTFFQTILQNKTLNAPIQFSGSDETNSFPVKGTEVTVVGSSGRHEVGSSKLHIKNIVNFGWEQRYYPGQLVCHHISGVYIAYAIITPGKSLGVVRVVNRETDDRTLIKGMKGAVVDLSFAHVKEDVVVGCVDELGNLFVYRITEDSSGLLQERLLEVLRDKPPYMEHRLIWCPYLKCEDEEDEDEEGDEESSTRLLVLTHGEEFEIWHVDTVVEEHGTGPLRPEDVTDGLLKISEGGGVVTDAAFSPDGTALATASSDGQVKFFQVYMKGEGEPRCLHRWSPHQGKPVSSLLFLDDHSEYRPNVRFWKYAVTGCDFNRELKIWSCETWSCLQTIRFESRDSKEAELRLKIAIDSTARYLVLSDIDRNLMYLLSLEVSTEARSEQANVVSVSEFPTPAPFLSFSVVSAGRKQVSMSEEGMCVMEQGDHGDSKEKTVVKLCLIQPKSLQECSVIFDDAALATLPAVQTFSSLSVIPGLLPPTDPRQSPDLPETPLPTPLFHTTSPKDKPSTSTDDLAEAASKISMITPTKFLPLPHPDMLKKEEETEETSTEPDDEPEGDDEDSEYEDGSVPKLERVNILMEKDFVSGNSSPSREVATILSTEEKRFEDESPADKTLQDSPSPDFSSTKMNLNSSGTIFPDPPNVTVPMVGPSLGLVNSLPMDLSDISFPPSSQSSHSSLETTVKELQKEVQSLRLEMSTHARVDHISAQVEASLNARLEASINRTLAHSLSKMEENLKKQEEAMIKYMTKTITTKCDQILGMELKRSVVETVNRALEPLKGRIDSQIGHKLNNADQVVRDSVFKVVTNQGFQDSIAKSVSAALLPVITESYREVLQANLPGMERMMRQILNNMNESFLAGTKEYEKALRGRLEASELVQREELSPYLRDILRSINNLTANQNKISQQICDINTKVETELPKTLKELLSKEVRSVLADKVTASPTIRASNIREIIQGMVSTGRLNEAFESALSANDLSLVMFTCELVNTTQIFSQPSCPLSQSVLLSLIQQLSVDLQEKTEVKFAFLEEAIIHLDKMDMITRKNIGHVLMTLQTSVQNYTQANPNTRFSRNFKTLMMAANGILAEVKENNIR